MLQNMNLILKKGDKYIEHNYMIELVYSLLVLCDYDILSPYNEEYKFEIKSTLGEKISKEDHEFFCKKCKQSFRFVIPCIFALSLTLSGDKLIMSDKDKIKPYYFERIGGRAAIDLFVNHLNSYALATNFSKFYLSHIDMYKEYMLAYRDLIYTVMNDVIKLYGSIGTRFTAYVSQLVHPGGFGVSVSPEHAKCVIGGIFKDTTLDTALMSNVYFHEFSHHFVDRVVDENWNKMDKVIKGLDIKDIYLQKEYISETLIRAISNYYCYQKELAVNKHDFIEYPYSKKLYELLIDENVTEINDKTYKMLFSSLTPVL